jgi:Flp pilus assembly protein TadG
MTSIRRVRRQQGNVLVETALAFTLLVPVFLGTFQFGLAFFYYNELASAVRAGARYANYRTYDSRSSTPSSAFVTAVRNMTVYGNPAGGTGPVVPGLRPEHIAVKVQLKQQVPHQVRVSVLNFPMNVVLKTFQISKPEAVFPYLGVYAPE